MQRVIAVGEMLIDFTALDENVPVKRASTFARNPGGAPANVAAAVARLGGTSAFVGCVGDDPFGQFLRETLEQMGVSTQYVRAVAGASTSLAFVARHHGEPDYFFVRDPGADTLLTVDDAARVTVDGETIVHFGSNSLAASPIREAVEHLITRAHDAGAMISFDVNLRPAFWTNEEDALAVCKRLVRRADLLKVNRQELFWLTGQTQVEDALMALGTMTDALVLCTLGGDGAVVQRKGRNALYVDGFSAPIIDATGAGDTFAGAVLYCLARDGVKRAALQEVADDQLTPYVRFANAAAAINVTRKGAMSAMPSLPEIEERLQA